MKAQLPNNEATRLVTLRDYNVLDTLPEQAFDDLTLIAKQICQTPIALITLIDEDRQWFKSRIGVGLTETPRDISFCSHAILHGDSLFEVPNAHIDPRFSDNPLVTGEPYVVFYAGAPMVAPDGSALGTLCVLDFKPRELNDAQRFALQALSRNVVTLLELGRNIAMRKQAEQALRESEERYRDLLENANVPIQSVALDGSFLYVNRAWRETFAYSEADIPSLLLQNIIHPAYLSYCLEIFRRVTSEDKPDLAQVVFLTKDGREVMVEGTSSCRFIDGKPVSTRTILRDITEQKRAERLLQQRNEELKSFAYTVSHDLKAPLRGISGYAQELDRRHQDGLSERAKFCIAQIITASKNLDNLIEDLLQYSRLDAENPTQSEIELLDFIQKILHDRSHTLTELGVVTTLNVAPLILTTWERGLHQILAN